MLAVTFLLLLVQGLIQYLQQASDGLDESTRERMQQRAEYLNRQMTQLLQELEQKELEQKNLEQSGGAWGALLVWQFWALTGILILLLALWFGLGKTRCEPDNSDQKERSSGDLVEEEGEEEEGHNITKQEIEGNNPNVEEHSKDGNEDGSNDDAKTESNAENEAKEGYANRDEKREEANAAANEKDKHSAKKEDNDHNVNRNLGSLLELPVLDLDKGCSMIMDLMDKFTHIFRQNWSNSFYPVPQQAIGVGSAFEGWNPHEQDIVYRVLVPLSAPPGHAFHLQLDTAGTLQRNFCVLVELLCTCTRKRSWDDILCFLHHSKEELRTSKDPNLLHTLCTGAYLDVKKTVHWFSRLIRVAWLLLPQSHDWHLTSQASRRSCKFQLSKDKESFIVEIIFGVRQEDSDIFVGSQPGEVDIPSTTWLETYAVAEAKFFRHISRQAPQESCHCKCLQLLAHHLKDGQLSSYALKTVVMHLLNHIPLTQWHRVDFQQRLMDILRYLRYSLDRKHLHHFIIGNKRLPMEISLPPSFRATEPPNLFQHLARSPYAQKKAMLEYIRLVYQIKHLLVHGH